jgi:PAT family beta-lactamase induction signal transducer AmpG
MFENLGHTDGEITVPIATVTIAWSLKPLWAAFLDRYRTKKFFVLAMELLMAALFVLMALALRLPGYFGVILALLWPVAFASATQDICVDGVYITSLDKKGQATWIGFQGVFWTLGRIIAAAGVLWVADVLRARGYAGEQAWTYAIAVVAVVMGALAVYHYFVLPTGSLPAIQPGRVRHVGYRSGGEEESALERIQSSLSLRLGIGVGVGAALGFLIAYFAERVAGVVIGVSTAGLIIVGWREHVPPFLAFVRKKSILGMLLFVFLYRTGEGFLLMLAPLFMQASVDKGGLGLSLGEKAWVDGTVSTVVSLVGGLLGGAFAARVGLKRALLPLAFFMNVPHLCYVYLSQAAALHPLSFSTILVLVSIEKFGYSFGFVGNMLYMMQQIAPGKYKMTHYAYATALMNLMLVPTQAASGPLADRLGYKAFFLLVLVVSIPSLLAAWRAPFPLEGESDGEEAESGAGPAGEPAASGG